MNEKMNGKQVMRSALEQWTVVERMQDVVTSILPSSECDELESATADHAEEALELLQEKRERTSESNNGVGSKDTEGDLEIVLERLCAKKRKKLAEAS